MLGYLFIYLFIFREREREKMASALRVFFPWDMNSDVLIG